LNKSDIRIMMVLDEFNLGGMETYTFYLTKALLEMGIHVVVIGRKGIFYDEFKKLNCPIYTVNFPRYHFIKPENEEQFYNDLRTIIEKERINLVNFHDLLPVGYLLKAIQGLNIPTILTVHGLYFENDWLVQTAKKVNAVISVSLPVQAHLQKYQIPSKVIHNGIDFDKYNYDPKRELRHEIGLPDDAKVILYAGRLAYNKAEICRLILLACSEINKTQVQDIHVVVAGTGLKYAEIQQLANKLNKINRKNFIHLIGKRHDMQNCYSSSDCVIGTGRVAIEAMACKRPVIAIGSVGHIGLVDQKNYNETLKYYFGDHDAKYVYSKDLIKKDIINILSSTNFSPGTGEVGREWAKMYFDLKKISLEVIEFFQSIK